MNGGIWHIQLGIRTIPAIAPKQQEASKSAIPWVTEEEIAKEQKAGRILLIYNPDELINIAFKYGQPGMDPYDDKWFKTSNKFISLAKETINKKDYYRVRAAAKVGDVLLYFDPKKWESKVVQLKQGDDVKAICQLSGLNGLSLLGYNCDLL